MVNEILFMEARVFSDFVRKFNLKPADANRLFENYGIWKYIEECYDVLHMNCDEYILNGIVRILQKKGACV